MLLLELRKPLSYFMWHFSRHRSTFYVFCYDRFLRMDPCCSLVVMTPIDFAWCLFAYCVTMIVTSVIHMWDTYYIFMVIICIWTCMFQRSICLTFISLSGTFVWAYDLGFSTLFDSVIHSFPILWCILVIVFPSNLIH